MGNGIVIYCENCNYSKNILVGAGEAYSDIENVLSMLNERYQRQITKILSNHDIKQRNFYKAMYVCIGCGSFDSKLYVQITYDDEKEFITNYICLDCEYELQKIDDYTTIKNYSCPECKKKTLSSEMNILWD